MSGARMAKSRICSIPDCGRLATRRGMCTLHYMRWWKYGDPLAGGTEIGEPERFFTGVVLTYEGDECLTWPYAKTGKGYGWIGRGLVSRRVCEEIHGPPPMPDHEAAHSCGNGHLACCTKGHLSWKTPTENQADRLVHDTHIRGERSVTAKLTESDVRQIKLLKSTGTSQVEIASKFGVSPAAIHAVWTGKSWAWL